MHLIEIAFSARGDQIVTVTGAEAVEPVIPRSAEQIRELKHQRAIFAEEVGKLLDDLPLLRS